MKLIAFFLLVGSIQVSANGFAQSISLSEKKISLQKLFIKINRQTGYQFFYRDRLLDKAEKVDINVDNASLDKVLSICFKDLPLLYSVTDKMVVIREKPVPVVRAIEDSVNVWQTISGQVKDAKGSPLAGVSVVVRSTKTGTSTDDNGFFNIEAKAGDILDFSIVGYKKKSITIGNSNTVAVQMEIEISTENEIVVVGYGTQKKENLTGSVSQVKMTDVLGDRPVINTTSALQGAIPGLQITRNSTPGQNSNDLNIRGPLSINGGGPLILIDNVPGDLGSLNPEDVETVTVLKDAASAAIYGARAAGGVVIITTKRPKSNAPFQVNYNNNFGSEKALGTPVQASLDQYLTAYLDAGFSDKYWSNSQSVTTWRDYLRQY
ncbi:MAG TPA: TonB-dependent receptor plug domain-containing protein, partial [Chitinophagaceae bacterium]|nr:TonB-dependent receptor plug domain-containing protein [Chitinophagaceae bacterium]